MSPVTNDDAYSRWLPPIPPPKPSKARIRISISAIFAGLIASCVLVSTATVALACTTARRLGGESELASRVDDIDLPASWELVSSEESTPLLSFGCETLGDCGWLERTYLVEDIGPDTADAAFGTILDEAGFEVGWSGCRPVVTGDSDGAATCNAEASDSVADVIMYLFTPDNARWALDVPSDTQSFAVTIEATPAGVYVD